MSWRSIWIRIEEFMPLARGFSRTSMQLRCFVMRLNSPQDYMSKHVAHGLRGSCTAQFEDEFQPQVQVSGYKICCI